MNDLISRREVSMILEKYRVPDSVYHEINKLHDFSADREKGKWEKIWRTDCERSEYMCSKCGCGEDYYTDFCPNCGADMRGNVNE